MVYAGVYVLILYYVILLPSHVNFMIIFKCFIVQILMSCQFLDLSQVVQSPGYLTLLAELVNAWDTYLNEICLIMEIITVLISSIIF